MDIEHTHTHVCVCVFLCVCVCVCMYVCIYNGVAPRTASPARAADSAVEVSLWSKRSFGRRALCCVALSQSVAALASGAFVRERCGCWRRFAHARATAPSTACSWRPSSARIAYRRASPPASCAHSAPNIARSYAPKALAAAAASCWQRTWLGSASRVGMLGGRHVARYSNSRRSLVWHMWTQALVEGAHGVCSAGIGAPLRCTTHSVDR